MVRKPNNNENHRYDKEARRMARIQRGGFDGTEHECKKLCNVCRARGYQTCDETFGEDCQKCENWS